MGGSNICLHKACKLNKLKDVKNMLNDPKIDVNAKHLNRTPLQTAVENNNLTIVYTLLCHDRVDIIVIHHPLYMQ
jgi:ankyrin repeat protein